MQRTVRTAHLSVLMTAQLQYTIQHRTVLIISPPTSRQTSQLRCCLSEVRGSLIPIQVVTVYCRVKQVSNTAAISTPVYLETMKADDVSNVGDGKCAKFTCKQHAFELGKWISE